VTDQDTAREVNASGAVTDVATTLLRAAFRIPIGTMKAACDMQKKMLEMMEGLIPGAAAHAADTANTADTSDAAHPSPAPPAAGPGAPASATRPASAAGGWGPVTPQDQVTGWGPMPR
jgi:hypothetical protein